jgi:hypothetical protein
MKIKSFFYSLTLCFLFFTAGAQVETAAGYTKATIQLANGSVTTGLIKDNIKRSASVIFTDESGNNKKVYEGSDINSLKTTETSYICINGDFFKTICDGRLCFLQKQSNAAAKASYNGTEAVFSNGTAGKIGDYFIYSGKQLKLLNKKTVESFITTDLAGCTAAIEKAKAVNGDIAKMQEAVEIYNAYTVK